jgi:hypothetical protein
MPWEKEVPITAFILKASGSRNLIPKLFKRPFIH